MKTTIAVGDATTGQGDGPMIVTEKTGLFLEHGLDVTSRIMGCAKALH